MANECHRGGPMPPRLPSGNPTHTLCGNRSHLLGQENRRFSLSLISLKFWWLDTSKNYISNVKNFTFKSSSSSPWKWLLRTTTWKTWHLGTVTIYQQCKQCHSDHYIHCENCVVCIPSWMLLVSVSLRLCLLYVYLCIRVCQCVYYNKHNWARYQALINICILIPFRYFLLKTNEEFFLNFECLLIWENFKFCFEHERKLETLKEMFRRIFHCIKVP